MSNGFLTRVLTIIALLSTVVCTAVLVYIAILSYEEFDHMQRLQGEESFQMWIRLMMSRDNLPKVILAFVISILIVIAYLLFSSNQNAHRYVLVAVLLTLLFLCFVVLILYFALSVPALFEKDITIATIMTDRITMICFPVVIICSVFAIAIIRRIRQ